MLAKCFTALMLGLAVTVTVAAKDDPLAGGLLWKVERDGEVAGYLFGTIHSEDPRLLDFSQPLLQALKSSDVFAMEIIPNIPTLTRLTELMHYQDGSTLKQAVGGRLYRQTSRLLAQYGLPRAMIKTLKPWAAAMTLSVPKPETGMFMDFSLSLRAAAYGAEVVALETLEEQVEFLGGMPLQQQREMLRQIVTEHDLIKQQLQMVIDTYLQQDLNQLQSLSQQQMAGNSQRLQNYFQQKGIDERNQRMAQRLLPMLAEQRVFVAIGALHLPGEQGLIRLLIQNGFCLSPVN